MVSVCAEMRSRVFDRIHAILRQSFFQPIVDQFPLVPGRPSTWVARLLTGLVHTPIDAPSYEPRALLVSWVGTVSEKAYARPDLAYEETNV